MEAIEVARTQHWQDLSESASALKNYLELVQDKSGAWTIDDWFVTVDERNIGCLERPVGEYVLQEEDRRDLQPVNHGEYLLEHLKVEFPEFRWPSEWYFLRIKEIRNIMDKLSLVSARRTFENTVCSVCETWQSAPRREQISSKEAVDRYITSCKARSLSPNTIEQYTSLLRRYIEANPQLPADRKPVEAFISQFEADKSRHVNFVIIRSFHQYLKEFGIVDPTENMKAPKVQKKIADSLSQEEFSRLLAVPKSPRDQAIIMVMGGCALRLGECINLKFGDIGEKLLKVTGKTGERNVPVTQDLRQLLLSLRNGYADDDPIFWGEHPHGQLKQSGMREVVKKAFRQAGITNRKDYPHTLRHTFGRIWEDNGGDLVASQDIMGHSSPETTRQYVNMSKKETIGKYDQFSPLIATSSPSITHDDPSITHDDQSLTPLDKRLTQC